MTSRDVVIRDIKTTTVPQLRDVHIRDNIIKDCILLGSTLTVGMYFPRTVSCLHRNNAASINIKRQDFLQKFFWETAFYGLNTEP